MTAPTSSTSPTAHTPPILPEILHQWLRHTQLAGLDIIAIATHQLPTVGNLDFINVAPLGETQFKQRPKALYS